MTRLQDVISDVSLVPAYCHGESMQIDERQRRSDEPKANAAARGLNILAVRDAELARCYMRHKNVPDHAIDSVLGHPALRRREGQGQSLSEAITPSPPDDQ